MVKNSPANGGDATDAGSIPGLERSPGGGHSNSLQYSCLENPTDRGDLWVTVHRGHKELDTTEGTEYTLSAPGGKNHPPPNSGGF